MHELHKPGAQYLQAQHSPLLERNPVLFWRSLALALALALRVPVLVGVLASNR